MKLTGIFENDYRDGVSSRHPGAHVSIRGQLAFLVFIFAAFSSRPVLSMWAGMSDQELIDSSQLIVIATYIGSTDISLLSDDKPQRIGILAIQETLKGSKQEVIFLYLSPSYGGPQRSDEFGFQAGQKGLWFLQKNDKNQNTFTIKHPQRFIPGDELDKRIDPIRRLLQQ